jgi:hypothetical protein
MWCIFNACDVVHVYSYLGVDRTVKHHATLTQWKRLAVRLAGSAVI